MSQGEITSNDASMDVDRRSPAWTYIHVRLKPGETFCLGVGRPCKSLAYEDWKPYVR